MMCSTECLVIPHTPLYKLPKARGFNFQFFTKPKLDTTKEWKHIKLDQP